MGLKRKDPLLKITAILDQVCTDHISRGMISKKGKLLCLLKYKFWPSWFDVMSGFTRVTFTIILFIWHYVYFNWGSVFQKDGELQCLFVITAHLNLNLLISSKSVILSPAVHAGVSLLLKSSSLISPVTLKATHTHTHTLCDQPSLCMRRLELAVCGCTYWHDQLLGSGIKPHTCKHAHLFLFHVVLSGLQETALVTFLVPECCCAAEITALHQLLSPHSSQGLLVFEAPGQNLSSGALGRAQICSLQTYWRDNGLETHGEGKRLRAGVSAASTHWARSQAFRSLCCW